MKIINRAKFTHKVRGAAPLKPGVNEVSNADVAAYRKQAFLNKNTGKVGPWLDVMQELEILKVESGKKKDTEKKDTEKKDTEKKDTEKKEEQPKKKLDLSFED